MSLLEYFDVTWQQIEVLSVEMDLHMFLPMFSHNIFYFINMSVTFLPLQSRV